MNENMIEIQLQAKEFLTGAGLSGPWAVAVMHFLLVVVAFVLAALSGLLCRRWVVPLLLRLAKRTEARWDDVLFSRPVLLAACRVVPAIVIWVLLPWTFADWPVVREVLVRLTAIYITVTSTQTLLALIHAIRLMDDGPRSARQQYLYTLCGVLKILVVFIAVIVVVAIVIDKNPATLFAGLGAASAILMLAFQDTIKGLVAGIRLTTNDMLRVGDWITVPSAGANGRVEDLTLTTVKVRNFDNTIVTVTPQTLVDGSFQNWNGMEQKEGRKQVRQLYYDFRSLHVGDDGVANITRFRHHVEQWLAENPKVLADKRPLVRQAPATQAGCCLEFVFWLRSQTGADFEHDTSDVMEYIYAAGTDFGLRIYQPFPQQ